MTETKKVASTYIPYTKRPRTWSPSKECLSTSLKPRDMRAPDHGNKPEKQDFLPAKQSRPQPRLFAPIVKRHAWEGFNAAASWPFDGKKVAKQGWV